ncbi:MAG: GNAT family N-acetyltransferase [Alphaproteobacteria bacterium]|nr:GNAT family N-acetyltransferase [Alphaproteobacteria bacterium]
MVGEPVLRTEQLILRKWRPDDLDPFAAMSADPEVMRYFPARQDRAETEAHIRMITDHLERQPFGWWAVEVPGLFDFAGFAGLLRPRFHAHFTPCVEVGWRLRRDAWGKGYATEAGQACLDFAFERMGIDQVVSMAVVDNRRSRRVMERLGMTRRPEDDFGHPRLPFDHPLRRHVLYRLSRSAWSKDR